MSLVAFSDVHLHRECSHQSLLRRWESSTSKYGQERERKMKKDEEGLILRVYREFCCTDRRALARH